MHHVTAPTAFGVLRSPDHTVTSFKSNEKLPPVVMSNIVMSKFVDDEESYDSNAAVFVELFKGIADTYVSEGGNVRPAKISTQMSVIDHAYKVVAKKLPNVGVDTPLRIIDFTHAYGERAVAAKRLELIMTENLKKISKDKKFQIVYHGIDPDTNISHISSKLSKEIGTGFRDIPLEQFSTSEPYHIVMMSTPPYDLEIYGGDSGVTSTYKSFDDWKRSFWLEVTHRAKASLVDGGVFTFTCLDRPNRKDRSYTAHALKKTLACFDFDSTFVVGANTPWWTFVNSVSKRVPEIPMHPSSNDIQTIFASALLSAKVIDRTEFRHEVFRTGTVLGGNLKVVGGNIAITCMFGDAMWTCDASPDELINAIRRLVVFLEASQNRNPEFSFHTSSGVLKITESRRIFSLMGGDVHHSSRTIQRDVVLSKIFGCNSITHVFSSPMLQDAMKKPAEENGLTLIHHSPISVGEGFLGPFTGKTSERTILLMNPPRELLLTRFPTISGWSLMNDIMAIGVTVYVDECKFARDEKNILRLVSVDPNTVFPDSQKFAENIRWLLLRSKGNAVVLDQEKFFQINCDGVRITNTKRDNDTVSVVFLIGEIEDETFVEELSSKRTLEQR